MNLHEKLTRPLRISDIDFRVQSINKGGYATILAYKDARADMIRLDEAVGPLNWKREHTRDNSNCIVSIYDPDKNQWVSKEDTGTESFTEKEKGLASDSFKRACFNWGIGRELYDYPVIQVKLNEDEFEISGDRAKATWKLKLREWVWESEFADGELVNLSCKDTHGNQRFIWPTDGGEIQDWQLAKIDSLIHTSSLMEGQLTAIERSLDTMSEVRANECIKYLKDNQKPSLDDELNRKTQ